MSFVEIPFQTGYPDEYSDTIAKMITSILQGQLAPIVETLREHARLLDFHVALLNGLDHDNIDSCGFKLQSHAHPDLPVADAHTQTDEPTTTHSTTASSPPSSVVAVAASSPRLPDRLLASSLAATKHADSRRPMAPKPQQLGGGSSVVPGPSRRLQRERPFSVTPDPMWNSSREILTYGGLATCPPPTYTEMVVPSSERVETVVIKPSTLQSPILDVREVSVIPRVPMTEGEEEVVTQHNNPPYLLGPSTTRLAQNQNLTASDDDDETDDSSNVESQLGETARGKKRTREEEYSPDDKDESEALERPFGEDCSSGSGGCNSNGTGTSSDRDGQPDRKRMKTRMGLVKTLTDAESWRPVKKLKKIAKLYRSSRFLL